MKKFCYTIWVPVCIDRKYKYEIEAESKEEADDKMSTIIEDRAFDMEETTCCEFEYESETDNDDEECYYEYDGEYEE